MVPIPVVLVVVVGSQGKVVMTLAMTVKSAILVAILAAMVVGNQLVVMPEVEFLVTVLIAMGAITLLIILRFFIVVHVRIKLSMRMLGIS